MTIEQDLLDCISETKAVVAEHKLGLVNLQNAVAQARAAKPFEQVDAVVPVNITLNIDDVDATLFGTVKWDVYLHDPSANLHRSSLIRMVQGNVDVRYVETQILGDALPVVVCAVQVDSCFHVQITNNHVRDLNVHLIRYGVKY